MHGSAERLARNAFEVLTKLPRHGMGSKISRLTWQDNSFWTVTRVETALSGKGGKAWGLLTWRGTESDIPTRIRGTSKGVWRPLAAPTTQQDGPAWPSLAAAALQAELSSAARTEAGAAGDAAEGDAAAAEAESEGQAA